MKLQPQRAAARKLARYALATLLAWVSCGRDGPLSFLGERVKGQSATSKRPLRPYVAPKVPLGINLSQVNYFATAIPFVDAMKMADPFQSTNATQVEGVKDAWDTHLADKIAVDGDGYPLEIPAIVPGARVPQIVRASVVSPVYGGRYTLLYDGDGEFDFPALPGSVIARAPGRIDLDIQPLKDRAVFVAITRSSRINHVRNVRLILPGFEAAYATQIFHPTFLARMRGVGAVRFMDWGNTNNSPIEHWSDRATPTMSQGTPRGVALETMIDLANRLDSDAWFCVPHRADDHYIEEMAKLIKARLEPKHHAYVEYSNEIWNGIFEQAKWASEQGCRAGLNKIGAYNGSCGDAGARYWAGIKWQAQRSGQIFQTFDRVFGAEAERVVHVIAGQAQNDHLNRVLVESLEDNAINPAHGAADVLAVAPYAGHGVANDIIEKGKLDSIGVPQILDMLEQSIPAHVRDSTRENQKIAKEHGLHLVAYEGGQHLVAYGGSENNPALVDKLIAANRDPRMGSIYRKLIDAWYSQSDDGLLMLFDYIEAPSKFGEWGLLESQEQPMQSAPKYQAFYDRLQRLIARGSNQTPPPSAAVNQTPPPQQKP